MIAEIIDKLTILLNGRIPAKLDITKHNDESELKCMEVVNQFIDFMLQIHAFIIPLSRGELHDTRLPVNNYLASPFKALHASLLHLTWQAEQVANGDYEQRVDFMGDFSNAFNSMIISLACNENLLKNKIQELENAFVQIRTLEGILPICASCKKVRIEGADPNKQDNWVQIEDYISNRTSAQFSHSICPECMIKLYPDVVDAIVGT